LPPLKSDSLGADYLTDGGKCLLLFHSDLFLQMAKFYFLRVGAILYPHRSQKFGKTIGKVACFGLNSRKSLRKAKSLFGYFRAFWVSSGIAVSPMRHEEHRGGPLNIFLVGSSDNKKVFLRVLCVSIEVYPVECLCFSIQLGRAVNICIGFVELLSLLGSLSSFNPLIRVIRVQK